MVAEPISCVSTGMYADSAQIKDPEPTAFPTGEPSGQPSSEPTSQPTVTPPPPSDKEKMLGKLWVVVTSVVGFAAAINYF